MFKFQGAQNSAVLKVTKLLKFDSCMYNVSCIFFGKQSKPALGFQELETSLHNALFELKTPAFFSLVVILKYK